MTSARPASTGAMPIKASDLRGLLRLGVQATVGITDLVEAMHHTIASRAGIVGPAPQGRTSGVTGMVYRAVRGGTRLVGKGSDALLGWWPAANDADRPASAQRDAALAVLNGVWGDHLAADGNPLAITMQLRVGGQAMALSAQGIAARVPEPSPRIVVLAHGLCMNDRQWRRRGHDHGQALARDLGVTPLYLHYNSGRHVSDNGREFADLLDRLVQQWPVPVQELMIVGHSMGGLVARSAIHQAAIDGQPWLAKLTKLVFLGTPHHGAPLERGGQRVDMLFGVSPYVAPFAKLTQARSAGITDLRFGNLQAADWQGRDRHAQRRDDRLPTPLPAGVDSYLVAATTAEKAGSLRSTLLGDGLVPLASALGLHRNPALALGVPETQRLVITEANHWDLLSRASVYTQLRDWLR